VCQGQTYSYEYICPQLSTFLLGYIFLPTRPIFFILILRVRRCLFYQCAKGLHLNRPSLYCFNRLAVNIFKKRAREISFLHDATVYGLNLCPAITFQPNVRIANLLILRVRRCVLYKPAKRLHLIRPSWSCFNRFADRPCWRAGIC
jgi:hypothetical protein